MPGSTKGLLVDNHDDDETHESFGSIGASAEAWTKFYSQTTKAAEVLFDTVNRPLAMRADVRAALGEASESDEL
jgi:hypothetical protein